MNILFSPPYIDQETIDEVVDTLRSNWITSGPKVKALEEEITTLTGSKATVCVNSWTSGAILMLKWFGVKEGDDRCQAYSLSSHETGCHTSSFHFLISQTNLYFDHSTNRS